MHEKVDLILGWVIVGGVTGAGWYYTLDDPKSWAQVVILGVTALVVVWYAHQARRTADETRSLADETRSLAQSSQRMAEATCYPNIMLVADKTQLGRGPVYSGTRILNTGPGIALQVYLATSHKNEWSTVADRISVGESVSINREHLFENGNGEHTNFIYVRCHDRIGKHHAFGWRFNERAVTWVPDVPIEFVAEALQAWPRDY